MTRFEVYTGSVSRAMQCLSTFCGHFQKLYITARTLLGTVVEFDTSSVCLSRKLFRVYDLVTILENRVVKLVCTCSADHERDWPPCNSSSFFRVDNQCTECEKQQQQQHFAQSGDGRGSRPRNTLVGQVSTETGTSVFSSRVRQYAK